MSRFPVAMKLRRPLVLIFLAALVGLGALGGPIEASHGGRIPHCGDYCEVEGEGGGCVYYGWGGQLVRTTATCRNGQWTPSQ